MQFTKEDLVYIDSVCERFNVAFKPVDKDRGLYKVCIQAGELVILKLNNWELPSEAQADFLSRYFVYNTREIKASESWDISVCITSIIK